MESCGLGQGQLLFSCEHGTELPDSLKWQYSWLAHELFASQKRLYSFELFGLRLLNSLF